MSTETHLEDTYDIIVVGAGAAGCVLANRLSVKESISVLLLDAGPDLNDDTDVKTPLRSRRLLNNPRTDWCFESEPQPNLNNRSIQHPRGKLLGGSTAINSHSLVYPSKAYHDHWVGYGNPSWNWESIEKYYGKFQTVQEPDEDVAKGLKVGKEKEKTNGPIQASYPAEAHVLQKAWIETLDAINGTKRGPIIDRYGVGARTIANAIDKRSGERSHAGLAYLELVDERINLTVITGALIENVVIEGSENDPVVKGVRFRSDGSFYEVAANREVILCAGVFGSPQILELSGIGAKFVLESAGVAAMVDLPGVGENLQDHLNYGPSLEVNPTIRTLDDIGSDPVYAQQVQELYDKEGKGPLSEGGVYVLSYQPLQALNSEKDESDLAEVLKAAPDSSSGTKIQYDFIKSVILSPTEASANIVQIHSQRYTTLDTRASGKFVSTVAQLSYPFSRGTVHITSPDATIHPRIDFKYLSHPLDAEILARHTLQTESILSHPPLSQHIRPNGTRLPAEFPQPKTIEDAKEIISKYSATNYHPCGTCAMMKRELGGVVDEELKVYGVRGLRVCDASIFPLIPRGNILTTIYAVAEKAADIILESLL